MAGLLYRLAPRSIIHSWAEVFVDGRWVGLEGVILDDAYLKGIRTRTGRDGGAFLGYGVGTDDLANPPIEWVGTDTRIQATGVNQDFGVFDDPDTFYLAHGVNARGSKAWLYRHLMRNAMNKTVKMIRTTGAAARAARCMMSPPANHPSPSQQIASLCLCGLVQRHAVAPNQHDHRRAKQFWENLCGEGPRVWSGRLAPCWTRWPTSQTPGRSSGLRRRCGAAPVGPAWSS